MQAILTKYLPATSSKPARIKASAERGSITVSYNHDGDEVFNHTYAASELCRLFVETDVLSYGQAARQHNPWKRKRVCGGLPGNCGYAHVFID